MPDNMSHEDIAKKFVDANVVDFGAMGKFITEMGPELAVNDSGWHGINIGRYSILACMLPAADVTRVVGNLGVAGLTAATLEGVTKASLPK